MTTGSWWSKILTDFGIFKKSVLTICKNLQPANNRVWLIKQVTTFSVQWGIADVKKFIYSFSELGDIDWLRHLFVTLCPNWLLYILSFNCESRPRGLLFKYVMALVGGVFHLQVFLNGRGKGFSCKFLICLWKPFYKIVGLTEWSWPHTELMTEIPISHDMTTFCTIQNI